MKKNLCVPNKLLCEPNNFIEKNLFCCVVALKFNISIKFFR